MSRSLKEATRAEGKAKVSRVRRIQGPWCWMGRSIEGWAASMLSVLAWERVLDLESGGLPPPSTASPWHPCHGEVGRGALPTSQLLHWSQAGFLLESISRSGDGASLAPTQASDI